MQTLDVCRTAVTYANTEEVIKYLNKNGIKCTKDSLMEYLITKINAKLEQLIIKQRQLNTEYNNCLEDSKNKKQSNKGDYYALLANISQSVGFSVPETTITAVVAEYIKQLNKKAIVNERRSNNKFSS